MDINAMMKEKSCSCGKIHSCDIEHVYIERGAISALTQLCEKSTGILIVADENTYSAAGEKTEKALLGKMIKVSMSLIKMK